MATAESGGGAGGKFRKKPTRRTNSTPYDRPTTALRPTQVAAISNNNDNNNNNRWFSKLVDPASKLITFGAHKLFSSVFRKRLLPPPIPQPQPDETTEIRDQRPENTIMVAPSGFKEAIVTSDSGGVAELEHILKQKTFTRSEIDRLTSLMMSRTVDGLDGDEKGMSEPKFLGEKAVNNGQEIRTNLPLLENRVEHAAISTPVVRSKVLDDVASPADLAKAYMGSRPTRASPSVVGLQNDMPREDRSATYNSSLKPKSSAMSLFQRPSSDINASDSSFMTPRFRGRSAIYSMARTPYSRLHPAEVLKAAETASDIHGASSSSSQISTELQQLSGSKRQVLKRRSSVLENDIGFVGPIRRIRQKPNLLHHKTLSLPASGAVHLRHGSERRTDVTEISPSVNWSLHHRSSTKALTDNGMLTTSNGYVPAKSVETAEKIFQHLDSLTQKGKSPEKRIEIGEGSSTEKRTYDMRDGLAGKNRSNTGSLKVLETSEGSRKENGLLDPKNAPNSSPKILRLEEVGMKKLPNSSVEGGSENGSPNKALENMIAQSISGQQQKKRGFQISAHEDYLELDDDVLTNDAASTPTIKRVDSNDLAKNSGIIFDNPQNAVNLATNPPAPNANQARNLLANKESPLPDGFPSSFAPPSSFATNVTNTQAALSSSTVGEVDTAAVRSEKAHEINNSNSPKPAPFAFSPSYSSVESLGIKTEVLHSESGAVTNVNVPAKTDKKNTFFGGASNKIEDTPSASNAAKGFIFGSPSNSAILSNGLSNSNGGPSPTKILSSTNDQTPSPASLPVISFSNGKVASSAGPVISTSTVGNNGPTFGSSSGSQVSTSIATPSVSSGPTFQFGSSTVLSTSATVGSTATESATKSDSETNQNQFGNLSSIPSSAKPSGPELTVPSPLKTSGNETPGFPGGSMFGLQPSSSSSAIGASISTQPLSSQSTTSTSSSIFGFTGPTAFDSSKVGNPFSPPVSSSASTAPLTSTITAPMSSTSGLFNWQSPKPTVPFGNSSQSTGFAFGSTTSGTSSSANDNTLFGASPNITGFAFGSTTSGTSSAANNNSTAPTVFGSSPIATGFAFGSTTSGTSSSANNNSTIPTVFGASSNTTGFAFGSTTSGTSPNTSISNSAPFIFGSTSSSGFSAPSGLGSTPAASSTPFPSQLAFGNNSAQPFTFGSTPPPQSGNNDQMSMEDSMAEDSIQVSAPTASVFGAPMSGPSSFVFGGAAPTPTPTPSMGNPFQFGGQQTPQNTPFQPSGSFELNAGGGAGSFSLGSGGVDKSNRRVVRVKNRIRKK